VAATALALLAGSAPLSAEAPVSSLSLRDLEGRKVALADYRGKSPVLVFFFRGFWCAYCVEQLVQLERLRASDLKDVPVLVVSPETVETSRKGKAALEREKSVHFTLRFLTDPDVKFALHYGLDAGDGKRGARRPSFVLVDRNGKEVWSFSESHYVIRPIDERVREGLAKLGPRE
jgi:peroxiredoxin